jgi:hypothetical protein
MKADADELRALAARVEAATGADRKLDALVLAAVVGGEAALSPFNGEWCVYVGKDRHGRPKLWEPGYGANKAWWRNNHFTASLDAALTLVPAGWTGTVHLDGKASLYRDDMRPAVWCVAATPALALVAAALRARAEAGHE